MVRSLRVLILVLAAACSLSLPPLGEGPRVVEVQAAWRTELDAVLPTDLVPLPDGRLAVLDGYAGRLWPVGAEGALGEALESEDLQGAVRLVPAAGGGFWATHPEEGEVRRLDAALQATGTWAVPGAVTVAEVGERVVVGLRTGGLAWLDPATGEAVLRAGDDVDGQPLGSIAQVVALPDGGVLAVDTLGHKVHRFDAQGVPQTFVGDFGLWIGRLAKPKAVALGPDGTWLIADSALSAVQLFEPDGTALGALSLADEVLRPGHPLAVHVDGERLTVLDARGVLHAVDLPAPALSAARERAELRHLRHPLVDPEGVEKAAGEERLCLQCHDGVVNDDRFVWDPALGHHPVGVVPERAIPAAFPVDPDGAIRCGTCHSPHGTAELAAVRATDDAEDRATLVRHRATEGDLFTRLSRDDAALCRGCHDDAAHDQVLSRLGLDGGAHPVGEALADALAARGTPSEAGLPGGVSGSCLTCHAPHGAARDALRRDTTDGAACLACHEDAGPRAGHPLTGARPAPRAAAALPVSEGGGPTCLTCHALIDGEGASLLRLPADGGSLCRSCHTSGSHAPAPPPDSAHARLPGRCLSCHDVHDAHEPDALLARTGPEADPHACASCHGSTAQAGHPVGTAHGDGVLSCDTCHEAHAPTPPSSTCSDCHTAPAQAAARGGHGGLDCAACHPPHADGPRGPATAPPGDRTCLACHGPGGSASRIAAWRHEAPVFDGEGPRWEPLRSLLLVDDQGQPVPSEAPGRLGCVSCHAVHGPHEGAPADHLRTPGWEEACGACHGANARTMYRWFHDPQRRSP